MAAEQRWREVMRRLYARLLVPLGFFTATVAGGVTLIGGHESGSVVVAGLAVSYVIVAVLTLTLWARAKRRSRSLAAEHLSHCNDRRVLVPPGALQSFAHFDRWRLQSGVATSPRPSARDAPRERGAGFDVPDSPTMSSGQVVDSHDAANWARKSLLQGSRISRHLVRRFEEMRTAIVLTQQQIPDSSLDNHSRALSAEDSDQILSEVLDGMFRAGGKTLVVEEEFARRSDPGLTGDLAFVEDRVLRWVALSERDAAGVRLIQATTSGYPLNAYVCGSPPAELGLIRNGSVDDRVHDIVDAVLAILVSAYDGETYVLLSAVDLPEGTDRRDVSPILSPEVEWVRALIRHAGGLHDRPRLRGASVHWLPTSDPELTYPLCRLIELCDDRSARSIDLAEAAAEILARRGYGIPSPLQWRWGFALSAARGNQELNTAQRYELITSLAREAPGQLDLSAGLLAADDDVEEGLVTPREFEALIEKYWAEARPELMSQAEAALGAESWLVRHA